MTFDERVVVHRVAVSLLAEPCTLITHAAGNSATRRSLHKPLSCVRRPLIKKGNPKIKYFPFSYWTFSGHAAFYWAAANVAHVRQSGPDSGLGFMAEVLKAF